MKPELWDQIAEVHRAALKIEKGAARAAFLTKACDGDEVLRREVDSLLALEGSADQFMENSAFEAMAAQLAEEQFPIRALNPGTKFGSFEILGPIGAGGMGEVYRARDSKLNRDVALKILPAVFTDDAERMARFRREAQVMASMNHPNIGSIYGLEEQNNLCVLVLELVEGPTLADRIAEGAVPLEEALAIARQIADAMAYAHEKGVTHRDLKPANIKITPEGNVKVLDFGVAKVLQVHENSVSDSSYSPTFAKPTTLREVGDVTVVLSKRRRNDGPKNTKVLVTNLPQATAHRTAAIYLRRWPVELFFKDWKEVVGVGQHQVTKDAARVERSVAVTLMAYLVLLRVRAKDIRPGQPWSAFALKHHFAWEVSVQHFRRCAQQQARREVKCRLAASLHALACKV